MAIGDSWGVGEKEIFRVKQANEKTSAHFNEEENKLKAEMTWKQTTQIVDVVNNVISPDVVSLVVTHAQSLTASGTSSASPSSFSSLLCPSSYIILSQYSYIP